MYKQQNDENKITSGVLLTWELGKCMTWNAIWENELLEKKTHLGHLDGG